MCQTSRKTDLFIFDLDGTLLDSLEDITLAVNHILSILGKPTLNRETVKTFVGDGLKVLLQRCMPEASCAALDLYISNFRQYYSEHLLDNTRPFAGIPELLSDLYKRNKTMAVSTNKQLVFAKTLLKGTGIAKYFNAILGGDSVPKPKPAPEPLIEILRLTKTSAGHAMMIGDSSNDARAGKSAGIPSCGVSWGFTDIESLGKMQFDFIASQPADILQFA